MCEHVLITPVRTFKRADSAAIPSPQSRSKQVQMHDARSRNHRDTAVGARKSQWVMGLCGGRIQGRETQRKWSAQGSDMYVYARIRMYAYAYTCIHVYIYACTYFVCMHAHVHAYTCIRVYVYACTYKRVNVYVGTYAHVRTRVHARIRTALSGLGSRPIRVPVPIGTMPQPLPLGNGGFETHTLGTAHTPSTHTHTHTHTRLT